MSWKVWRSLLCNLTEWTGGSRKFAVGAGIMEGDVYMKEMEWCERRGGHHLASFGVAMPQVRDCIASLIFSVFFHTVFCILASL